MGDKKGRKDSRQGSEKQRYERFVGPVAIAIVANHRIVHHVMKSPNRNVKTKMEKCSPLK